MSNFKLDCEGFIIPLNSPAEASFMKQWGAYSTLFYIGSHFIYGGGLKWTKRSDSLCPCVVGEDCDNDYYWWDWNPRPLWEEKGDNEKEWIGGPVPTTGWYIYPYCHPMCCRPVGPFKNQDTAITWSRRKFFEDKHEALGLTIPWEPIRLHNP